MINISNEFIEIIKSNNRNFTLTITVNGTDIITQDDLLNNVEIHYSGASNSKLSIGEFCKSSCVFCIDKDNHIELNDAYFTISMTVEGASDVISLGKYWVNSIEYDTTKKYYKITSYDVPPFVSSKVEITNNEVSVLINEFETKSGMTITNKELITLLYAALDDGMTWQELIASIVGYNGYNIRTDREGNLELYRYMPNISTVLKVGGSVIAGEHLVGEITIPQTPIAELINSNNIFENGLTSKDVVIIDSVSIDNDKEVLERGNGYGIRYKNKNIKELNDDVLFYMGRSYSPMSLHFRGNPAIEIGDILYVLDQYDNVYSCYVMDYVLTFDGGMSGKINSYAAESLEKVIQQSPVDKKIESLKNNVNSQISGIVNHFYVDDEGVHVTEIAGTSENGNNILLNGQGLNIQNGNITKTSFTKDIKFYDDENHVIGTIGTGELTKEAVMVSITKQQSEYPFVIPLNYKPVLDEATGDDISISIDTVWDIIRIYKPDVETLGGNGIWTGIYNSEDNSIKFWIEGRTTITTDPSISYYYNYLRNKISFDFGMNNKSSAGETFTYGTQNNNNGEMSVALGQENIINEDCKTSVAIGRDNEINTNYAFVMGEGLKAESPSTIVGCYNKPDPDWEYPFIVGVGRGFNEELGRRNGLTIDWNGNGTFGGNVYAENIGKMQVKNSSPTLTTSGTFQVTDTINVDRGVYIASGSISFAGNSTGRRVITLTADSESLQASVNRAVVIGNQGSAVTIGESTRIFVFDTDGHQIKLGGCQYSGGSLSCSTYLQVVQIK